MCLQNWRMPSGQNFFFQSKPSEKSSMLLSADMHLIQASSQWLLDKAVRKGPLLRGPAGEIVGYNVCMS